MRSKYTVYTAMALVVANMMGTGVFTSLGFQVKSLSSGLAVILLWVLGGLMALSGALTYSEAVVLMPRCGGEYHFLSRMYHPALGFLAGWISFLVGFAAPVAASSVAFASYFQGLLNPRLIKSLDHLINGINSTKLLALLVVVVFTAIHAVNKIAGAKVQNIFTTFNVMIIFFLIAAGLRHGGQSSVSFAFNSMALKNILSPAFAIAMFFVSYSYSGWNAAAYIADEVANLKRNVPLSLIIGSALVMIMYVLLNFVFLYTVPINEMVGRIEVGHIFAAKIFGQQAGMIMSGAISLLLLASVSSMVIAGPRVSMVMGEDHYLFRKLSRKSSKDIPFLAVIIQGLFSIIYILTSGFERMIIFTGFTLNLFTFLTVLGVMITRHRHPELRREYKTLGYPFTPLFFLIFQSWIIIYGLLYRPKESLAGVAIALSGLIIYLISSRSASKVKNNLPPESQCPEDK
ncbi:MAG: amino acid permease [Candidatus Aminicenantes bacterium]|nr:MAG: amino acid permease [Candidatus Aminicenantes bacterium]